MLRRALLLLAMIALGAASARAQSAILQGGPVTAGHVPSYAVTGSGQPVVTDGGGANGGGLGTNLGEIGITSRSPSGTYPSANSGTGPNAEHACLYDGPTTNAGGYHYLCLDPNAAGGGLLSYGAAGGASQLPLQFSINGVVEPPVVGGANSTITSLSGLTTPLSVPQGGTGSTTAVIANRFPAVNYGPCAASGSMVGQDAGACANAAISAAAAAGGGTVVFPCGTFNQSTQIFQQNSGVGLIGCGVGPGQDNVQPPPKEVAYTRLTWTGAVGGQMIYVGPPTPYVTTTESLYDASVEGIEFNGASLANVCFEEKSTNYSIFKVLGTNCRMNNTRFIAANITDAPGTQENDIWTYSRDDSTNAAYAPVGIQFDADAGSAFNFSLNRVHAAEFLYYNGDGVVVGNADHNTFDEFRASPLGGKGRPVVFANSAYVMSNGNLVGGYPRANLIVRPSIVNLLGYNTNLAITPGTNSCNGGGVSACGPSSFTQTISTASFINDPNVIFSSNAGVLPGMQMSCGNGSYSGVIPGSAVGSLSSTTTAGLYIWQAQGDNIFYMGTIRATTIGTICTFSTGVTRIAAPGTYVMTAASGTTFSLTTVPTGGHAQTGVAISGGAISFADMVIPFTGTATAGDTWTITVPIPSYKNRFLNFDVTNNVPGPVAEPGASFSAANDNAFDIPTQGSAQQNNSAVIGTAQKFILRNTSCGSGIFYLSGNGAASIFNNVGAIPSNSQLSFQATLTMIDLTNPANTVTANWGNGASGPHVLARGLLATNTTLDGAGAAVAPDSTRGLAGGTYTLAPQTNLGGFIAAVTPPNADCWAATETFTGTLTP